MYEISATTSVIRSELPEALCPGPICHTYGGAVTPE